MRVLITSLDSLDWLSRALSEREGVEVAAMHAAFVDLGDFGVSRVDTHEETPYLLRSARVFPVRPYPYSLYLGGVAPLLRSFQPDIIYHHGEPSELGTAQVVRSARRLCPDARIVLFSFENVRRKWRGFPRCLRGWAERVTIPRVDIVAACTHTAKDAWTRQGFDPARIRVVYYCADESRFFPRDAEALRERLRVRGRFLVGYVGRLVYEKGVDVLLRALARLPEEFVLTICGSGRHEEELRALADEVNVQARIRWLGRVGPDEMPTHLSAFDVLALPSRSIPVWQEQFGRVLAEAMLCETAVVGSSCGAIPEVIGDAGLVFPENDAEALADCLGRLAEDADLRAALAGRGRERALAEFTQEVFVSRLVSLFRSVES